MVMVLKAVQMINSYYDNLGPKFPKLVWHYVPKLKGNTYRKDWRL